MARSVLKNGGKAFEMNKKNHRERLLEKKVARMERVIGELTLELKKTIKEQAIS
tara:strand:+ start:924 stop:1085 length:162 start_codon:yes stop_codon:yes gene_type:complete